MFFIWCQFNYKTELSFCPASYNYDFILVFFMWKKKSFKNVQYEKKKFFIRIYFGSTDSEQKKKKKFTILTQDNQIRTLVNIRMRRDDENYILLIIFDGKKKKKNERETKEKRSLNRLSSRFARRVWRHIIIDCQVRAPTRS